MPRTGGILVGVSFKHATNQHINRLYVNLMAYHCACSLINTTKGYKSLNIHQHAFRLVG